MALIQLMIQESSMYPKNNSSEAKRPRVKINSAVNFPCWLGKPLNFSTP